jgi:hypothetical protein
MFPGVQFCVALENMHGQNNQGAAKDQHQVVRAAAAEAFWSIREICR